MSARVQRYLAQEGRGGLDAILAMNTLNDGKAAGGPVGATAAAGLPEGRGGEEFINKREVARRLNKKLRTVDNWMRAGWLPYYKIGHTVAFRWSEVEAHLEHMCRVCRRIGWGLKDES